MVLMLLYIPIYQLLMLYMCILDHFVSPLPFVSSSRLIDIEYNISGCSLLIISVYLPSQSRCTDGFKETLDWLDGAIMVLPPSADLVIMEDFNADLQCQIQN